jgi:hypothetical protein
LKIVSSALCVLLLGSVTPALAAAVLHPEMRYDDRHDLSPPLRAMAIMAKPRPHMGNPVI